MSPSRILTSVPFYIFFFNITERKTQFLVRFLKGKDAIIEDKLQWWTAKNNQEEVHQNIWLKFLMNRIWCGVLLIRLESLLCAHVQEENENPHKLIKYFVVFNWKNIYFSSIKG